VKILRLRAEPGEFFRGGKPEFECLIEWAAGCHGNVRDAALDGVVQAVLVLGGGGVLDH
jgi:hypothetical protein